jgi:hypothetical protein
MTDLLKGLGRAWTADLLGGPVDLATQATNLGIAGTGYLGHKLGLLNTPPALIDPRNVPFSSDWLAAGTPLEDTGSAAYTAGRFTGAISPALGALALQAGGQKSNMLRSFPEGLIQEFNTPEYKSREKLIPLPIDDFLKLANKGVASDKLSQAREIYASGKPYNTLPQLWVDNKGRVVGHEGRHRAIVERENGQNTIPVLLKSDNIRWTHQNDPTNFDYTKEWPSHMQAQAEAADPSYAIPFLPREQAMTPYSALLAALKEFLAKKK